LHSAPEIAHRKSLGGLRYAYPINEEGGIGPSRATIERYIREQLKGESNPFRKGLKALRASAGYIDRLFDENAGDAWAIDEWELDGIFYSPQAHDQIFQNPRPYLLSIIDERTTFLLNWKLVISLDAEAVLDWLEETIRRYGKPRRLVSDKGGHFRRKVGGRRIVENHGELVSKAMGALGALGVERTTPGKEKNPQANRIERVHEIYADLARRDFGASWCGANTREREQTGIDERIRRHLTEHCKLGTCGPQLLSLDDAERIIGQWVGEINTMESEAKGLCGMTRQAAFQHFLPSPEERAKRRVDDDRLAFAFARYFPKLKIRQGGIVELPNGKRYGRPGELWSLQGKTRVGIQLRHDDSFLILAPAGKGQEFVIARRRPLVGIADPALDAESEALARMRKFLRTIHDFQEAQRLAAIPLPEETSAEREAAPTPAPLPQPEYEISGVGWVMERDRYRPRAKPMGFADLEE
jgi:hypothetical protein